MKKFLAILLLPWLLVACPVPLPVIETFIATPSALPYGGGQVKFVWATKHASAIFLNGVNVSDKNTLELDVSATTIFTLEARGAGGVVRQSMTLAVETTPPPTIASFRATPNTLPFGGGTVLLEWTSEYATHLSLEGTDVTGQTSRTVQVTTSKSFTLVATGISGRAQKTTSVFVQDAPPVIAHFSATPDTLERGPVSLTWDVLGADSLSITPNIGIVTGDSIQVFVEQSTTFTLTASNNGGTVSKSITVASTALSSNALGLVNLAWDTNKRSAETDSSGRVRFTPLTYSDIDYVMGGVRYLTATFRVTNLDSEPLENISLRAIARRGNLGATAAFDVRAFPSLAFPEGEVFTDPSVAQRIVPLHGMQLGISVAEPDSSAADFQAYRPSESSSLEAAAQTAALLGADEHVLDYGFVVKNGSSRRIEAGGTGLVSVSFRIPRRFDSLPKVFKFQVSFLLSTDSALRVSRALLETTTAAETRGVELGRATNPTQLVLFGNDNETASQAAVRVIRLPNIKIGSSTTLP
ncbi:MAG: hypothetical protein ACK41E_07235 [Deinococcales bacterium]